MNVKILSLTIIILIVIGSFGAVGTDLEKSSFNSEQYAPGEVIIGFFNQLDGLEPVDVKTIDSFEGYNIIQKIEDLNIAVVEVPEGKELDLVNSFSSSPYVEYAEPNYAVYATHTPNDPRWSDQWGPKKINCPDAWNIEKGDSDVVIAIIDTGVDYNHEDIAGNYISGGYDFVNDDNNPMDDDDHGTHCAGIAAAVMDNNKGIAGVAQVSILAEKVLDSDGSGWASDIADGINHAVNQGVHIISMSLSCESPSGAIESACNNAYSDGVLLVAASGNDGDNDPDYPAAYSNVIAVGATDEQDNRCSFSNYGNHLELVAPGTNILSTVRNNGYSKKQGTSMATPHVAGVAALIKSLTGMSNSGIRQRLRDTAVDLGDSGKDIYYGYGRVDALAAIKGPTLGKGRVMGNGNGGESYAEATCYSVGDIECESGEKIYFGIEYKIDCWGMWDEGEVKATVNGVTKSKYTTGNEKGYWSWEITCYPGNTVEWSIFAWLDDTFYEYREDTCSGSLSLVGKKEPDLKAWSSPDPLRWIDVKPGESRSGTIYIKNDGDSGSTLKWQISEDEGWITCDKTSGSLSKGEQVSVGVTVQASGNDGTSRNGEITVKNTEDSGDKVIFDVTIKTKNARNRPLFFNLLELLQTRYPLLFNFISSLNFVI